MLDKVPTQEVGGCFDALQRYRSLRCLVPPFLLSDRKQNQNVNVGSKKKKTNFHHHAVENVDHRRKKRVLDYFSRVKRESRFSTVIIQWHEVYIIKII